VTDRSDGGDYEHLSHGCCYSNRRCFSPATAESSSTWRNLARGRDVLFSHSGSATVCASLGALRGLLMAHNTRGCTKWRSDQRVTVVRWMYDSFEISHTRSVVVEIVGSDGKHGVIPDIALIPIVPSGTEVILRRCVCGATCTTGAAHVHVVSELPTPSGPRLVVRSMSGSRKTASINMAMDTAGHPIWRFIEPGMPEFICH